MKIRLLCFDVSEVQSTVLIGLIFFNCVLCYASDNESMRMRESTDPYSLRTIPLYDFEQRSLNTLVTVQQDEDSENRLSKMIELTDQSQYKRAMLYMQSVSRSHDEVSNQSNPPESLVNSSPDLDTRNNDFWICCHCCFVNTARVAVEK